MGASRGRIIGQLLSETMVISVLGGILGAGIAASLIPAARATRVNPETQTIEWPNGADMAPEFLHEKGTEVAQVA